MKLNPCDSGVQSGEPGLWSHSELLGGKGYHPNELLKSSAELSIRTDTAKRSRGQREAKRRPVGKVARGESHAKRNRANDEQEAV